MCAQDDKVPWEGGKDLTGLSLARRDQKTKSERGLLLLSVSARGGPVSITTGSLARVGETGGKTWHASVVEAKGRNRTKRPKHLKG